MSWTDERITEMKRLFELNYSCSQIATELGGTTRCAVIGKLNRLGLHKETSSSAKSSRFQRPPRQRAPRKPPEPRFPDLTVVSPDEPEIEVGVFPNRISLIDATESQCRWPAADDGGASMVCGETRSGGHAWCPRHCRVAYEPIPLRRRVNKPVMAGRFSEAI